MASSLAQFAAEFEAELNDAALTGRVVTTRRNFENLRSAPRVGLIEAGGSIVETDRPGMHDTGAGKQRIVAVRERTVSVMCHGQTEEQAETLLHNTLVAARAVLHGAIRYGAESWPDQEEGADGFVRSGRLAVWEFIWQTPVYDTIAPLTVLTAFEETETFGDEEIPCAS